MGIAYARIILPEASAAKSGELIACEAEGMALGACHSPGLLARCALAQLKKISPDLPSTQARSNLPELSALTLSCVGLSADCETMGTGLDQLSLFHRAYCMVVVSWLPSDDRV
jgi:hypothetical protein